MKSLLADMCAYLFTFLPPDILPWFNKVILSLWLTLFNTTETFLKTRTIVDSKVNHFLLYWKLMNSNCKKKNDNGFRTKKEF